MTVRTARAPVNIGLRTIGLRMGWGWLTPALGMLCLLSPALARPAPQSIAVQPVSRLAEPWWRARFQEKQRELHRGPVDLLWIGDSITQNWERTGPEDWRDFAPTWKRFYGDRHAVDLGFKGDSTCHLLWRLENGELDGISPRGIVLLIGANNFGHIHTDAAATYAGIAAVLDQIHRHLPNTPVILIGVLPSIRSNWVSVNTAALDAHLRRTITTSRPYVTYVDLGRLFIEHGQVDPDKFLDPRLRPPDPPLHPTAQVQAEIARAIEPLVSHMLGDAAHS